MFPSGASLDRLWGALPRAHIQEASPLGLVLKPGIGLASWSKLVASIAHKAGGISRDRDTVTAWLGDLLAYGGGNLNRKRAG